MGEVIDRWQDLGGELWIGAAAAGVVWFALFGLLAAATNPRRVEPGPATLDLGGTEPPAVVNYVTQDWRLGREAIPATLLDLAARGHLAIDQVGEQTLVRDATKTTRATRATSAARATELTTYDRMVLDHVRGLARDADDGVVPAEALTTGPDEAAKGWWRRFQSAVRDDARARGLSRSRWSPWMKLALTVAAIVVGIAVALAISATAPNSANPSQTGSTSSTTSEDSDDSDPIAAGVGGGLLTVGGLLALVGAAGARDRDTPAGRAAAARWLGLADLLGTDPIFAEHPPAGVAIWDRHLAYGAGLGVAHGAVRALPLGTQSDTEAWSPVGGRWRLVRVRYPVRFPPAYGRPPLRATTVGLLQLVVFAALLRSLFDLPDTVNDAARDFGSEDVDLTLVDRVAHGVATALTVAVALLVLRAAVMFGLGVLDLVGGRTTVEGRVLRSRARGSDDKRSWQVAVDDGSTDRIRAWRLYRPADAPQGVVVRAQVTRHLAHVKELERVGGTAAPEAGADADADDPTLATHGLGALLAAAAAPGATTDGSTQPTGPPPPLPDLTVVSEAARRPMERDAAATPYPFAVDGTAASYRGPDGAHIQLAWASPVAITAFAHLPRFLFRRVDGLGDEAYRARFGGQVTARLGSQVAVVMAKLPGRPDDERDRVTDALARAMLDRVAPPASTPSPAPATPPGTPPEAKNSADASS